MSAIVVVYLLALAVLAAIGGYAYYAWQQYHATLARIGARQAERRRAASPVPAKELAPTPYASVLDSRHSTTTTTVL
ncbi:hypothetical protein SDRG_12778 [Saprolegnia diclina VS20]|uniref:Uncharacterized protein n=1 Tax=Saprolegnia diclina (strain VS20) TaxID=1156394 RepID=T0PVL2_SAPDV|nr:hypothetical protein SDRG_12778 [Saprolegnia diclina VS20]EQC29529.1 hypothetical protein SDRG_12778 [Saprolegnia diclina VS20]|eukprot:XP_008617081.1 hypothetical protein SDRG_12778 [Saprolegnia diclina VS20]